MDAQSACSAASAGSAVGRWLLERDSGGTTTLVVGDGGSGGRAVDSLVASLAAGHTVDAVDISVVRRGDVQVVDGETGALLTTADTWRAVTSTGGNLSVDAVAGAAAASATTLVVGRRAAALEVGQAVASIAGDGTVTGVTKVVSGALVAGALVITVGWGRVAASADRPACRHLLSGKASDQGRCCERRLHDDDYGNLVGAVIAVLEIVKVRDDVEQRSE